MQFSSDRLISIIGRKDIEAFFISAQELGIVAFCMKPFQFGRGLSGDWRNHPVCQIKSKYTFKGITVEYWRFKIGSNFSFDRPFWELPTN